MMNEEMIMQWLLARFPRPLVIVLRILGGVFIVICVAAVGLIYLFAPGALFAAVTQDVMIGIVFGFVWLMIHIAIFIHYEDVETWLNKTYPPRKPKEDSETP